MKELQAKLTAVGTAEKAQPTPEELVEVEGSANMMVKKPSTCTDANNCKFICEEFVGVDGA